MTKLEKVAAIFLGIAAVMWLTTAYLAVHFLSVHYR